MIIVSMDDGRFWTGRGWSAEYPNAKTFSGETSAVATCAKLNTEGHYAKVVRGYGTTDEQKIYPR